jgi:3'-5' exoribonuclease
MDQKPIKDFVIDDKIEGYFVVRRREVREFVRGQFVSLELGDATGRVNAVWWEPDQFALTDLAEGMVVKVRGDVGQYQNKVQLAINRLRQAQPDEFRLEDVLPHSTQSREERHARIRALTDKIESGFVKALAESFWSDEAFLEQYLYAAAGKLWHHAYIGGLSEHSANVAELAVRAATGYPFLNKDFLIFGGLFHDAGKLASYSTKMVIDFTDEGRLIDHICIADAWVAERAAKIEAFPPILLTKLRHMILAHQGERAFGSPVVPQMPEAFVLYYCDEIDSKMGAIDRIRTRQGGTGWSEYVKLLDRFLYFGEPESDQS